MRTAYIGGEYLNAEGRLRPGTIVAEDGIIVEVSDPRPARKGEREVDCRGKSILPGLIDLHFHLTLVGRRLQSTQNQLPMRAVRNALRTLRAGVTTVRNLGGDRDLDFGLRDLIQAGQIPGPDILSSGSFLHVTGGHCAPSGATADGVAQVRQAAREQLRQGADWIKMMCSGGFDTHLEDPHAPEFTFDEITAAVEVAGFRGRRVAAHAHAPEAIKLAVRAGAASIEHCSYLDEESADLMIENGVFMVPTIAVYQVVGENPNHELQEKSRSIAQDKRDTLLWGIEKGIEWGVGSDGGLGSPFELFLDELVALVELVGLDPAVVLTKATSGNAALLGLEDRGRIAEGLRADLIVIDGDPVGNIHDIVRIERTVAGGREFAWADMNEAFGLPPMPVERPAAGSGFGVRQTPQRVWAGAYC